MRIEAVLAASAILLGACRGEDQADVPLEEVNVAADTSAGFQTEMPAPVTPVPDSDSGFTVVGNLTEVNESGVEGDITLTGEGSSTELRIRVRGAQAGGSVGVGIFAGNCRGTPGEAVTAVESLQINETGIGTATLSFPLEARSVQDGRHSVQVRPSNAGPSTPPVACAEIPVVSESPGGRDTLARQEPAEEVP